MGRGVKPLLPRSHSVRQGSTQLSSGQTSALTSHAGAERGPGQGAPHAAASVMLQHPNALLSPMQATFPNPEIS